MEKLAHSAGGVFVGIPGGGTSIHYRHSLSRSRAMRDGGRRDSSEEEEEEEEDGRDEKGTAPPRQRRRSPSLPLRHEKKKINE